MKFLTVEFNRDFSRDHFECTHDSLNNYLKFQATKESKAGLAKIYVLLNSHHGVIGYYSLSSAELPRECVPEEMLRKLPQSYSGYPAILLGRLAVTKSETGRGLGGELVVDAIHRCIFHSEAIGTSVILVDPIDEKAREFYMKYLFRKLPDSSRMILKIDQNLKDHFLNLLTN